MSISLWLRILFFVTAVAVLASAARAASSGWVSLFDGKSISNWVVKGGTAKYTVEEGAIVGTTVEKSKNTFLCTKRDYADFELELRVRCDRELIRIRELKAGEVVK